MVTVLWPIGVGSDWHERYSSFKKKRFVKTSNVNLFTNNRKNTPCLEYSHRVLVSNFIHAFPQTCEATEP